jgi:hypothetical protein
MKDGVTLPEMFGYDEDKFIVKFDELMSAIRNSTDDSDVIKLVDIIADEKIEAIILTWCVAKAGSDLQDGATNALFEGTMNAIVDMFDSIEDQELSDSLSEKLYSKLLKLKSKYDDDEI